MSVDGNAARRTGPALEAMYQFILWLIPAVEKFPRSQKFLLGDRIQTAALDVLERLIEATYTRGREALVLTTFRVVKHFLDAFLARYDLPNDGERLVNDVAFSKCEEPLIAFVLSSIACAKYIRHSNFIGQLGL